MTREEAIAKLGTIKINEESFRADTIGVILEAVVTLGLLKLEEPKTMEDEAKEYLESYGHGASYLLFLLQKGGFKIVRET